MEAAHVRRPCLEAIAVEVLAMMCLCLARPIERSPRMEKGMGRLSCLEIFGPLAIPNAVTRAPLAVPFSAALLDLVRQRSWLLLGFVWLSDGSVRCFWEAEIRLE